MAEHPEIDGVDLKGISRLREVEGSGDTSSDQVESHEGDTDFTNMEDKSTHSRQELLSALKFEHYRDNDRLYQEAAPKIDDFAEPVDDTKDTDDKPTQS